MLGYEVWSEKAQTYVPAEIPEEPTLSLKLCVDIKAYAKHDPPLICEVTFDWYNMCVRIMGENQQVDMDMKATADTGAQVDVIGTDHVERNSPAGNLGVFFARVKGKHYKTGNLVEVKTMMHVIKSDTMLLSRRSLWKLGVVEDEFPQIGKYLKTAGIEAVKSEPTP